MDRDLTVLAEAARSARSAREYEEALFEQLQRKLGFDVAFCVRGERIGPVAPGLEDAVRRSAEPRWDELRRPLAPMMQAALAGSSVIVDRDFFGARGLEAMPHYQVMMRPHRGRSSLISYLGDCAGLSAGIVLGRTTPRWLAREQRWFARALPLLSLCERVVQTLAPQSPAPPAMLTPRERDVLGYLQLGYTNREIACACGTSPRTVRNQLSAIFAKLGASTRAEAVALSLGHGASR
jgi:DNA-binding CsgD family transcriptional regulator